MTLARDPLPLASRDGCLAAVNSLPAPPGLELQTARGLTLLSMELLAPRARADSGRATTTPCVLVVSCGSSRARWQRGASQQESGQVAYSSRLVAARMIHPLDP